MLPISNCIAYRHTNVCFKQVLTDHCAMLNLSNNENLCSVVVRVSSFTTAWKTIVHCFAKGLKGDQRGRCNCQPKPVIKSINLQEYLAAHIYMTTPVAKNWYKMLCLIYGFFLQIVYEHFECIHYHSQILSVDWSRLDWLIFWFHPL